MFTQNTKKRQQTLRFGPKNALEVSNQHIDLTSDRGDKRYKLSMPSAKPSNTIDLTGNAKRNAYTENVENVQFTRKIQEKSLGSSGNGIGNAKPGSLLDSAIKSSDNNKIPHNPVPFGRTYSNQNNNADSVRKYPLPSKNEEFKGLNSFSNDSEVKKSSVPFSELTSEKQLSSEQHKAIDIVLNEKKNVFITGSAGTGKSVLLSNIIRQLTEREGDNKYAVAITAPTGIAAFQIGGTTLHSWAGVGIGRDPIEKLIKNISSRREAKFRWLSTKVLIIDESDFYQLPPVETRDEKSLNRFVFESEKWNTVIHKQIVLTRVFRQRDMKFVDILNEIRLGSLKPESTMFLRSLSREPNYPDDGIRPTELYALRNQVETANKRSLELLPGKVRVYHSANINPKTGPITDEETLIKIDNFCRAARKVELKINAQVLLIKNMPESNLVNGSRGVVLKYVDVDGDSYPLCRFTNGVEMVVKPEEYEAEIAVTYIYA
ncbi:ATP-dependent DNA helicase RRM3 [Smittium culicis]|uniref:ATP-dependent DNA helicase n=1 Tax=Smittium culicis TaxID=133412 RepID=A0A1R1YRE9_9FUNG|nr:ATP-dependent DNA helicase RRM3 [Smittium culicis]